jgi:hypothetical protein
MSNEADTGLAFEPLVSRGFMARELDVANAYRLNNGLADIRERMRQRKDCPNWFIAAMDDALHRSNCLIRPLIDHRDELASDPTDVRGYVDTMLGG